MHKFSRDLKKDKSVMFFTAVNPADCRVLFKAGIDDLLISYHYIKKSLKYYEEEVLPRIYDKGGVFMTDSGAFSILKATKTKGAHEEQWGNPDYWNSYLDEYCEWLDRNSKYIYCAANLDLEGIVGYNAVDKWNEKYFKPLESKMGVVYVAHTGLDTDHSWLEFIKRYKYYLKTKSYVGYSSSGGFYNRAGLLHSIQKQYPNVRVHGFGWTSIPVLRQFPLQTTDSTTWKGGDRYGTTYRFDGTNFRVVDFKKKHERKAMFPILHEIGVTEEDILEEVTESIHLMNLYGWKGAREIMLKFANMKLTNKPVLYYAKNS